MRSRQFVFHLELLINNLIIIIRFFKNIFFNTFIMFNKIFKSSFLKPERILSLLDSITDTDNNHIKPTKITFEIFNSSFIIFNLIIPFKTKFIKI